MKKISILIFIVCIGFWQCTKDAAGLATVSGSGGSLARFAIAGNYLYSVDERDLKVFDISIPGSPQLQKTVNIGFDVETIYPFKENLFIGSASRIFIYSVADPLNPRKLSEGISPQALRRCDPVVAKDTVAFATLRTNGDCGGSQSTLAVFDIKDITKPLQKASFPVTEPYGLGYQDDALYVCDKTGLMIFDISKPYTPALKATLRDATNYIDVIPYQGTLICWVKEGVVMYDISKRFEPRFLAKIL
jgi:hypothetical protein